MAKIVIKTIRSKIFLIRGYIYVEKLHKKHYKKHGKISENLREIFSGLNF